MSAKSSKIISEEGCLFPRNQSVARLYDDIVQKVDDMHAFFVSSSFEVGTQLISYIHRQHICTM